MQLTTAVEAMRAVTDGQRVYIHGGAATPTPLLHALKERARGLRDVQTVSMHLEGPAPHVAPDLEGHIRHNALFIGANVRLAVAEGRADYTPVFLSDIPRLFADGGLALDVALIQVSPPDSSGYCSLGVSVDVAQSAVRHARTVIAEVNEQMPRTLGDSLVHSDEIDFAIRSDRPILEVARAHLDERHVAIGRHVASLVDDGSTLQMGIGGTVDGLLAQLRDHRDLGIHTEMFSDGVVDLVEAGVVTGGRKRVHPGQIVSSFVMGSQRVYDFVRDNPTVAMHPSDYTNDPVLISQQEKMVAVNSAIEVDLTGQVCADSIGGRFYSGIGGQLDFIRGAARAEGGRPIIALTSTVATPEGEVSRIVSHLARGAGVVTTRGDVHYVVTEHGIAALHGRSIRERAQRLLDIAAPAFRERLAREAFELYGVRLRA